MAIEIGLLLAAVLAATMLVVRLYGLPGPLERACVAWLVRRHGQGEAHQYMFYRCEGCARIVTWRRIRVGGCDCGRSMKLRPARLTRGEKMRCLFAPWTV